MNTWNKNDMKYTAKSQKSSKVLLVCVYDTVVFQITNDIIRSKFQKFGVIKKLLIFEKGEVTKFFIQYDQIQCALKAKNNLDGTKLCNSICKMSIYFSNFCNVDLKHQTTQGFSLQNYQESQNFNKNFGSEVSSYTKGSNKQKSQQNEFDTDPLFMAFGGPFEQLGRSKTDDPKTLQNQIKMMSINNNSSMEQQQINPLIKQSIDNLIGPNFTDQPMQEQTNSSSLKMKEDNDVKSKILWLPVRYSIPCYCIYNLFSNFGNISCIVSKKERIFIKFRTKQFSAISMTYLSNTTLLGNILSLKEYSQIGDSWKPTEGQYCECTYYDFLSDRFTPQRSITINPPSQTLHVSSMKREICQQRQLWQIFSEYGAVQKVHILQQSREKNMALVKFKTIEDSFNAIAHLHNESFSGRKIQISFTKSKV